MKPPGPHPTPCAPTAEARSRLQWADGKSIKNEVDLQVGAGHCGTTRPRAAPGMEHLVRPPSSHPGAAFAGTKDRS